MLFNQKQKEKTKENKQIKIKKSTKKFINMIVEAILVKISLHHKTMKAGYNSKSGHVDNKQNKQ